MRVRTRQATIRICLEDVEGTQRGENNNNNKKKTQLLLTSSSMGTEAGTGSSGTTEDGFRLAPSQYDFFYQSTHTKINITQAV